MSKADELAQEELAMDILTGSMYSINFLKNITLAIFDPDLESQTVGETYTQWLKKCNLYETNTLHIPYSLGSIIGYLYCGILLAKEKWYDLLPEENINSASPDWGFSSINYSSPKKPSPTIKDIFKRMRNALGHGHIVFNVPSNFQRDYKDKDDFEKKVTLKLHDVNMKDPGDTFDIEIPLLGHAIAVKKFHSIAYAHVTAK
jgi:hypothetical protein